MASNRRTNARAWIALLLGAASIPFGILVFYLTAQASPITRLFLVYLAVFLAASATVVAGHSARRQIRRTHGLGGGLAIAGLAIGYLFLVLATVALAMLIAWLVVCGGTPCGLPP
jgi:zinc transporter ZupT